MDLLHRGHINLLRRMREEAGEDGIVVVILHSDDSCWRLKGKVPIQDITQRVRNLTITDLVDHIWVTYEDDPAHVFEAVVRKFSDEYAPVYMRGDDLTEDFPGYWKLKEMRVPIKFIRYTDGVSSTALRDMLS